MVGIPILSCSGRTLAETWENSLKLVMIDGIDINNQYEATPSRDCSMLMTVHDPLAEPMITRCLPGGLEDLWKYYCEVCLGTRDHEIRNPADPEDKRWSYTYHDRLTNYRAINQIEAIIDGLYVSPFTRRVQAITWKPEVDLATHDPPCLQSIWCRLSPNFDGYFLNMNTRWRSRDAYRAAFMNMFVMVEFMKHIASELTTRLGVPVYLGRYVDFSDSYHIYGSMVDDVTKRALPLLTTRSESERTYTYSEYIQDLSIVEGTP